MSIHWLVLTLSARSYLLTQGCMAAQRLHPSRRLEAFEVADSSPDEEDAMDELEELLELPVLLSPDDRS